jgi:hypothetical protein
MKANTTYSVKKWEEKTLQEFSPGVKTTKASVEYALTGGIEGSASVEYLMFYKQFNPDNQHESTAVYVGLIVFHGSVAGKKGSFVMEDNGSFENGTAKSALRIINSSGSGELKQISGTGSYSADKKGIQFELEYTL